MLEERILSGQEVLAVLTKIALPENQPSRKQRIRESHLERRFHPFILGRANTLRANIDETESAAIITERGGQENHRERSQDGSSFCSQFA